MSATGQSRTRHRSELTSRVLVRSGSSFVTDKNEYPNGWRVPTPLDSRREFTQVEEPSVPVKSRSSLVGGSPTILTPDILVFHVLSNTLPLFFTLKLDCRLYLIVLVKLLQGR